MLGDCQGLCPPATGQGACDRFRLGFSFLVCNPKISHMPKWLQVPLSRFVHIDVQYPSWIERRKRQVSIHWKFAVKVRLQDRMLRHQPILSTECWDHKE